MPDLELPSKTATCRRFGFDRRGGGVLSAYLQDKEDA
jgi:hypothetical protein